jgi:hypothetical protein
MDSDFFVPTMGPMTLLGPLGILSLSGVLLVVGGNVLVWRSLIRHGGGERSNVLFAAFHPDSPMKKPENSGDRFRFRLGIFLVAMGMIHVYTGFTVGSGREERVCVQHCRREGFNGGHFAPSAHEIDKVTGKAQRACWCTNAIGSVEISQPSLFPMVPKQPANSPPHGHLPSSH